MIKKWDIILIAALLAASFIPEGVFLLGGNSADKGGTYAVIQVDGKEYKTVPLSDHHGTDTFTIRTESGYNTVVVRDQEIGIVEADCPDKICIGEGFISPARRDDGLSASQSPHRSAFVPRRRARRYSRPVEVSHEIKTFRIIILSLVCSPSHSSYISSKASLPVPFIARREAGPCQSHHGHRFVRPAEKAGRLPDLAAARRLVDGLRRRHQRLFVQRGRRGVQPGEHDRPETGGTVQLNRRQRGRRRVS